MLPQTISTTLLAEAIGEPLTKLTTWANRGLISSEIPRRWTWLEAICVGMFAIAMRSGVTGAEASRRAAGMVPVLGDMLNDAQSGSDDWERLIFISARGPAGDVQNHSCRNIEDARACISLLLEKGAEHIEMIDATDLFKAICWAFVVEREKAEARRKAKAPA